MFVIMEQVSFHTKIKTIKFSPFTATAKEIENFRPTDGKRRTPQLPIIERVRC